MVEKFGVNLIYSFYDFIWLHKILDFNLEYFVLGCIIQISK